MSDVTKFYNLISEEYMENMFPKNQWTKYVDQKEKRTVNRLWKLNKSDQTRKEIILDLGMGPGRWSQFFLKKGFKKIYGIDISSNMVRSARQRINSKKFKAQVADMKNIPFQNQTFDKIFCFRSLKYLSNPNPALLEMKRVLKPGGSIIIETPNCSLQNRFLSYLSKVLISFYPKLSFKSRFRYFNRARFYSIEDLKKICRVNKLRIVKTTPLFVLPSVPLPTAEGRFLNLIKFLDNILISILPNRYFVRSWVLLIENE